MLRLIHTCLFFILTIAIFAEEVPVHVARKVANNFISKKTELTGKDLNALYIRDLIGIIEGHTPYYYVFDLYDNEGFVIIAADDRVYPVLGYSLSNNYSHNDQPPAFKVMMNYYIRQISYIIEKNIISTPEIKRQWETYSSGSNTAADHNREVLPLLTTTWDQNEYYNDSCPEDPGGPGGHAWAGCVATAMAQILRYHEYPECGSGSHSYDPFNYDPLFVDFENTTYYWIEMPDAISAPDSNVAQIIYHCGVSVNMNYSAGGSSSGQLQARYAFVTYFKYSDAAKLLHRDGYTDSLWVKLLKQDLDRSMPVFCVGYSLVSGAGHAFICDGYQNDNYFHYNWGWSGVNDGYYLSSLLNPGTIDLSSGQDAIVSIRPDTSDNEYCYEVTYLNSPGTSIQDGSGQDIDYSNNTDCKWIVMPGATLSIKISFEYFDLADGNDILNIYQGISTSDTLLGSCTGTDLPEDIISSGESVLLHFISDDTITSEGWKINIVATRPDYCSGTTMLTDTTGTFEDGSLHFSYKNNADCKWLIQPPGVSSIILSFSSFETEEDYDSVYIYDGNTTSAPLLAFFHGDTLPPEITSSGSSMLVHFVSDGGMTYDGWTASYESIPVSVTDQESSDPVVIYPNPSQGKIYIEFNNITKNIFVETSDIHGRILDFKKFSASDNPLSLDVSGYPKGIYFIRIFTDLNIFTGKVVIK